MSGSAVMAARIVAPGPSPARPPNIELVRGISMLSGVRPCLAPRARFRQRTPSRLARPERLELPTLGFEDRYSIQLSYGRVRRALARVAAPANLSGASCERRRAANASHG